MLVVGCVLGAVGAPVFQFVASPIGSLMTFLAILVDGLGILVAGIGLGRRPPAPALLVVAGGLLFLYGFGVGAGVLSQPVPSIIAMLVVAVAMVGAAIAVSAQNALPGMSRRVLLLPAIWLFVVAFARMGWAGTTVLGLAFALSGVAWLTVRDRSARESDGSTSPNP